MGDERYVVGPDGKIVVFPPEMQEEDIAHVMDSQYNPRAVLDRVMRVAQTPLTEQFGLRPPKMRIPGVTEETEQYLPKEVRQTVDAVDDLAHGLTSPLSLAMIGSGSLLARTAPKVAEAIGVAFGAPQVAAGAQAAKEGNIPKAVIDIGLGASAMLPFTARAAQPVVEATRPVADAAVAATKQTLDIGQLKEYSIPEAAPGAARLALRGTVRTTPGDAAFVVSERLNEQNIPTTSDLTLNAGEALGGIRISEQGIINALSGEGKFYANAPDLVEKWITNFRKNRAVQKLYSARDLDSFESGLRMTAAIFGDQYPDPVVGGASKYRNPIRINRDDLFGETFDLSTICPRQDQYLAIVRGVEARIGRLLNPIERFTVGRMMFDAGEAPACFFCYGQSARDLAEFTVTKTSDIFQRTSKLLRKNPNPTPEQLQEVFGTWHPYSENTGNPSNVLQLAQEYKNNPRAQALMRDQVRLRDLVFNLKKPQSQLETLVADKVRKAIQGATMVNMPKDYAMYTDQLMKKSPEVIAARNAVGGLRMNSQTDFRIWHILDTAKFLSHAQAKGAMAHVYTRQPEFIEIFGGTGIKFNISMEFAHDKDGKIMRDTQTGEPLVNTMNTMPFEKMMEFRERFPRDVGTMLVAMTEEDALVGMQTGWVDMMIPYHAGAVKPAINQHMKITDFAKWQHEAWPSKYKEGQQVPVRLSNGKRVTVTVGKPITRAHHFNDQVLYLEMTEKLGFTPRYSNFLTKDAAGKWQAPDGYMKAVRDIAREPSNQTVVDPRKINWQAAHKHVEEWVRKGGDQPKVEANPALLQLILNKIEAGEVPDLKGAFGRGGTK